VNVEGEALIRAEFAGCNINSLQIKSPTLTVLNLKNNKLLRGCSLDTDCLTTLDLEGCDQIQEKEFRTNFPNYNISLLFHLEDKIKKLIVDLLSKEEVILDGSVREIKAINEALRVTKKLKKLTGLVYEQSWSGTFTSIYTIDQGLRANKTIEELTLSSMHDQKYVFDALIQCITAAFLSTSLKKLDLSNNQLSSNEAKIIGRGLQSNTSIKELNLLKNNFMEAIENRYQEYGNKKTYFSIDGIIDLFTSLQSNTSLEKLRINGIEGTSLCAPQYNLLTIAEKNNRIEEAIAKLKKANPSLEITNY
jgi:hypothetical protein